MSRIMCVQMHITFRLNVHLFTNIFTINVSLNMRLHINCKKTEYAIAWALKAATCYLKLKRKITTTVDSTVFNVKLLVKNS